MEFLLLIGIYTVYLIFKKFFANKDLFSFEKTYQLSEYDKSTNFTEKQREVIDYLNNQKQATETQILNKCSTTKTVINNLIEKGAIQTMKFNRLGKKEIITLSIIAIILIAMIFFFNYFLLVKLNLRYFGIFVYALFFLFIGFNVLFLYIKFDQQLFQKIVVYGASGFVVFALLFFFFGGRPYLHAEQYASLIEIEEEDFIEDINTVDINTLPIVDKSYGAKLGSLKLGEYPGIGSEFQPGEYSDIIYQGKQYLVAPLEYRGFFKWTSNNDTGTPGYILIDKVTSETQLINIKEATGNGMKYIPSAYFSQDLTRHAYYNGLNKYRLENSFFEIDEEGNPYYVMQYSLPTIFINGGNKIHLIAVVNAIDGEVEIYEPDEVPSWVESVYPNSLIFEHLNYWGSLQEGWLNSIFAQRGVLQTSSGTRVIMNENELFYFTGLTSAGNDESTIGFIYANMRTKETRLFRFPGATEEAAMNKALTLIPQNNISTSFPIPLNVQNTPTYFILIKGEDGRILRYVFIEIQDLEFYSISESKADAYNRFLIKLNDEDDAVSTQVSGTITDIKSYVNDGFTIYWVEIDNDLQYMINVGSFTNLEMQYFISRDIGDDIEIFVVDSTIVGFGED